MKRIINGKSYNTDTATLVWEAFDERIFVNQAIYQTRHGAFFKVTGDANDGAEDLQPQTDSEAQAYLEKHANGLVEQYFGVMSEGGAAERRLTVRVPGNLADRMEAAAKAKGLSLNSYAMRCFENGTAADDFPAKPN